MIIYFLEIQNINYNKFVDILFEYLKNKYQKYF
jgi:hypothetical protein